MSDKKNDKVGGWAGSLDDEEEDKGVQADIARKILALNPSLRDAGVDTMRAVESTKARDEKKVDQPDAGVKGSAAPKPVQGNRIVDAIADVKRTLDTDDKRLEAEIARLTKERAGLKNAALERIMRWLQSNDPDLRSPVTQAMLQDEKPFLDKIGFSIKKYIDAQKKR